MNSQGSHLTNLLFFNFQDNSSLRSIIDKPPIVGKELLPLTPVQLAGFRLHPGVPVSSLKTEYLSNSNQLVFPFFQLPEKYRYLNTIPTRKHKKKDKKHKYDNNIPQETSITELPGDTHEKKHKKDKRKHDDDKERKKRKKEKKRKKQRSTPESTPNYQPSSNQSLAHSF